MTFTCLGHFWLFSEQLLPLKRDYFWPVIVLLIESQEGVVSIKMKLHVDVVNVVNVDDVSVVPSKVMIELIGPRLS